MSLYCIFYYGIENHDLNFDAEKTSQTMQMCVLESSGIESSIGLL